MLYQPCSVRFIISSCNEFIDLNEYSYPNQFAPYTWEACVVKISDKISYLGRDIEDALRMDFIDNKEISRLIKISKKYDEKVINTTVIIHNFIVSICENSSPEKGIRLSDKHNSMLNEVKDFNYNAIYRNTKFDVYRKYAALIIRSIFDTLMNAYDAQKTPSKLQKMKKAYPTLIKDFIGHINQYSLLASYKPDAARNLEQYKNVKVYGNLETRNIYAQAIIDYISGMTDRYAIEVFNELIRY